MKVIDPGHEYLLDSLDGECVNRLVFVKRVGDKYPGNAPPAHAGTTTQEVLRALLERAEYVNRQRPCEETEEVIFYLQKCLFALEKRAARLHGRRLTWEDATRIISGEGKCGLCGHVGCRGECRPDPTAGGTNQEKEP